MFIPRPTFILGPRAKSYLAAAALIAVTVAVPFRSALAIDMKGGTIEVEVQLPTNDEETEFAAKGEDETKRYFGLNACTCDKKFRVKLTLKDVTETLEAVPVQIWVGDNCDDPNPALRDEQCKPIPGFADVNSLRSAPTAEISVRDLVGGLDSGCPSFENNRNVYVIIDKDDDGFSAEDNDYQVTTSITVDTTPPPLAKNPTKEGAENAISVSWEPPEVRVADVEYFQFLCTLADGSPIPDYSYSDALFRAPNVCEESNAELLLPGAGSDAGLADAGIADDAGASDAGVADDAGGNDTDAGGSDTDGGMTTSPFADRTIVCGGKVSRTSTSKRITGLRNGVEYRITMVSIDKAGNPTTVDLGLATPKPVKDFWEDYQDSGGTAEGGCQSGGILSSFGALAALGLIGGLLSLRKRWTIFLAIVLTFGLTGAAAFAQGYDDVDFSANEKPFQDPVTWNFDLKFGPYVPDVDKEFTSDVGPFERMFGDGPFFMSQAVLDFFFLHPLGELGAYGSVGFLGTSANAFAVDDGGNIMTDENGNVRSNGDSNAFRMIPTSFGLTYRFTWLDDAYHIPLVPYARLGLSYYIWWVKGPSGDDAEAPTDDCADPSDPEMMCEGNKARGASWGWQTTLGLAIRAERIDPDAERGLQNELGIYHASFFFEMLAAKVDGFGSEKKLSLGDTTWLAGIGFEF